MSNVFSTITQRGTQATLDEVMSSSPRIWENHCQELPSDAPDELYVWLGSIPLPTEYLSGYQYEHLREFSFSLVNKEYTLAAIFDQTTMEDDRHGMISKRVGEFLQMFPKFMEIQFATMLTSGGTDTAYDGTSFFSTTRTIGNSGTIDNDDTENIGDPDAPLASEILTSLQTIIAKMHRYADDQGQVGYNYDAMKRLRCVIPPEMERAFREAVSSTIVSTAAATASMSNPWGMNLVEFDTCPFLGASDNTFYVSALGASRWPYVRQMRVQPYVTVFNSDSDVEAAHGMKIQVRARYRFGYGEPRRALRDVYT